MPFAKRSLIRSSNNDPQLTRNYFGLVFKNPVGLAAGFDKNAKYLPELEALGFGFVEIGTVTPLPQKGNPKPRLFRLKKDNALLNRMGFNNDGVLAVKERLQKWRSPNNGHSGKRSSLIIGGNIGKNKFTSNEDAWKDYEKCFTELFEWVDYFVVNVSSPNTPGLRQLQQKDALGLILSNLQNINQKKPVPKPLFVKISPDLEEQDLDDIITLTMELKLTGIVATNTTIRKNNLSENHLHKFGDGGISGSPLKNISTTIIKYICEKSAGKLMIIGSGGIFNGKDAVEKIAAGSGLVQVWTGFIYQGPSIVSNICREIK